MTGFSCTAFSSTAFSGRLIKNPRLVSLRLVHRRLSMVTLAAALASGCSLLSDDRGLVVDRSKEYTEVEEHAPLQVPEGLEPAGSQSAFVLPEIVNTKGAIFPDRAPRPQPIYADDRNRGVKIQKLGDRRWLVVGEPPAIVWPKLKQFLAENGVATTYEEARLGRVLTQWLEVGDDRYRDVVRLSIQQAKQAEATPAEDTPEDTPQEPGDPNEQVGVDEAVAPADDKSRPFSAADFGGTPESAAAPTPEPGAEDESADADADEQTANDTPSEDNEETTDPDEIEINTGVLASALGVSASALDPTDVFGALNTLPPAAEDDPNDLGLLALADGATEEVEEVPFDGDRERIVFSIEQGMRDDNTEVHIRHQVEVDGVTSDLVGEEFATTASSIDAVEENLLRELGGYLAAEVSSQAVSKVGQTIIGSTKAALDTSGDGQPILRLSLDFDRAWASIGQALENAEVPVTNRDRDEGVFFVDLPERALTGEENSGFFRRLLGRSGSIVPLQIQLTPIAAGGYQVRALDSDAQPTDVELARDVLNLIREFAI